MSAAITHGTLVKYLGLSRGLSRSECAGDDGGEVAGFVDVEGGKAGGFGTGKARVGIFEGEAVCHGEKSAGVEVGLGVGFVACAVLGADQGVEAGEDSGVVEEGLDFGAAGAGDESDGVAVQAAEEGDGCRRDRRAFGARLADEFPAEGNLVAQRREERRVGVGDEEAVEHGLVGHASSETDIVFPGQSDVVRCEELRPGLPDERLSVGDYTVEVEDECGRVELHGYEEYGPAAPSLPDRLGGRVPAAYF